MNTKPKPNQYYLNCKAVSNFMRDNHCTIQQAAKYFLKKDKRVPDNIEIDRICLEDLTHVGHLQEERVFMVYYVEVQ